MRWLPMTGTDKEMNMKGTTMKHRLAILTALLLAALTNHGRVLAAEQSMDKMWGDATAK